MPRGVRKPSVEGAVAYPAELTTVATADDLQGIVDGFKLRFPGEWAKIHLCPLEYGLADMIEALQR